MYTADYAPLYLWLCWIYAINIGDIWDELESPRVEARRPENKVLWSQADGWMAGPDQCDLFIPPVPEQCEVPNSTQLPATVPNTGAPETLGLRLVATYLVCGAVLLGAVKMTGFRDRCVICARRLWVVWNPTPQVPIILRRTRLQPIEDKISATTLSEIMLGKSVPYIATNKAIAHPDHTLLLAKAFPTSPQIKL